MRFDRKTSSVLLFVLTGCSTTVTPPPHPADPVVIFLTDYGRHSSLLLPQSIGGYKEYAFGDWEFFAKGNTQWWVAVKALVHSPRSTLGRRHLEIQPDEPDIKHALGASRVMSFQASREKATDLLTVLDARFEHEPSRVIYSDYSTLYHVPDTENYWIFHNCNHVTAEWLRQLGCTIHGPAIFSNFEIKQDH